MGSRKNHSRKHREKVRQVRKARYDLKELERLKKTLGLPASDANERNEFLKNVNEIATMTPDVKMQKAKQEAEMEAKHELQERRERAQQITVVNENTGVVHIYNSKTLKDQHGSYPPWFKPRKTIKHMRKKMHARKKEFKQFWKVTNVPL